MTPRSFAARHLSVLASALLVVTPAVILAAPAHATSSGFAFQGNAYGSQVNLNSTLVSGPSAFVTMGCSTTPGTHGENDTASVNLGNVGSIGVTVDTVDSAMEGDVAVSQARSEVATVSLLNGMITADLLTATSRTQGLPFENTGSSVFVNLKINGASYTNAPAPNTKHELPGLGYVVLNEQSSWVGSTGASMVVNALHLVVTQTNPLGVKISTNLILGHAQTSLSGPVAGVMDGFAFGTTQQTGNVVKSGRTAYQSLGCTGTGGKEKSNTVATVSIPGLTSGTVTSTVTGQVRSTDITGEVQNTIQSVNLLDGLVTADLVTANVGGTRSGGSTVLTDGSHFVNLKVRGHVEISDQVPPNTMIPLDGIGTLWLHKVVRTGTDTMEVRMIELIVESPDAPLPIDTVVRVSVAKLRLHG